MAALLSDPPALNGIYTSFHHQVQQYGPNLLSLVAQELERPPPAISIILQRYEWPPSEFHWAWAVGSADSATERAVLNFFQTDVGKQALAPDSDIPTDAGVEFKLASVFFRLPPPSASNQTDDSDPDLHVPASSTAATAPLQEGQEVDIASGKFHQRAYVSGASTTGWLQVAPEMSFSRVLAVELRKEGQGHQHPLSDLGGLEGWVVDPETSTVYGKVAGLVGARTVLVTPLAELE